MEMYVVYVGLYALSSDNFKFDVSLLFLGEIIVRKICKKSRFLNDVEILSQGQIHLHQWKMGHQFT